jgi:hypothetical protein
MRMHRGIGIAGVMALVGLGLAAWLVTAGSSSSAGGEAAVTRQIEVDWNRLADAGIVVSKWGPASGKVDVNLVPPSQASLADLTNLATGGKALVLNGRSVGIRHTGGVTEQIYLSLVRGIFESAYGDRVRISPTFLPMPTVGPQRSTSGQVP